MFICLTIGPCFWQIGMKLASMSGFKNFRSRHF
jgi:hypothetical protein